MPRRRLEVATERLTGSTPECRVGGQALWSLVGDHMELSGALGAAHELSSSSQLECMAWKVEGLGWLMALLKPKQARSLEEKQATILQARERTLGQPFLETV